jgi:20S proteasome alpha/beta subunit
LPMTIIIGATCDGGKTGIAVADRMLTSSDLSMAFEHDVPKITRLCDNCVALTAGSALAPTDVFKPAIQRLADKRTPAIGEILECVKEEFVRIRNGEAEDLLFKPRGLTISQFYQVQSRLDENVILRLDRGLEEYSIDLHVLLVGVDSVGAHLFYVMNPGVSRTFSNIGFCNLGTGERYAESTFVANRYNPMLTLNRALFIAYEAKKQAEGASGVGKTTDITVVDREGIHTVSATGMRKLDETYNTKMQLTSPQKKELDEMIESFSLKGLTED